MKPALLACAAVCALVTIAPPLAAQEAEPPTIAVQALDTRLATTQAFQLRIEEALETHRRNRLFGNGLVTAGAAFVVGALVDWAAGSGLGMSSGATGAMLGGMSLVVWGADRHSAAREALRRAERWQGRAPGEPGR